MAEHINLLKLCVGVDTVEDLQHWQNSQKAHWPSGCAVHVTRMWPKREEELLGGGSIYWIIKDTIQARQRVVGLKQVDGGDGIKRCALVLDAEIIRTQAAQRRPFQGWRYLSAADAPGDLAMGRAFEEELPPALAQALAEIGLR